MNDRLLAESTECDYKAELEYKKPKSWLKSVSAFANGNGGTLIFGIDDEKHVVGLVNPQKDAEMISSLIKDRIMPYPDFTLLPDSLEGKDLLVLTISAGRATPYYYHFDGITEAYIRVGNESVPAPNYVLNQLLLRGMNQSFDSLTTEYDFDDYAFTKLRERYRAWTGNSLEDKLFDSFEIRDRKNKLTNAGALIADDSPIRQSRLFCTHWNGLNKSGGIVDAIDSAEYTGSLIILLNEGMGFVKRNTKTMWKKTPDSRIEMPDYCERSVFEALVNALIHRDYSIIGSEVHIDIYDDRLTIYSPGGMVDGTRIQDRDISGVSSVRRNPIIADIFGRLGYMERQGSGFRKITDAYSAAHNYTKEYEPVFFSDAASFQVTLYNLNRNVMEDETIVEEKMTVDSTENPSIGGEKAVDSTGNPSIEGGKPVDSTENSSIEAAMIHVKAKNTTIRNAKRIFDAFGYDGIFGRIDVRNILGIKESYAGELLNKMKNAGLIESISGFGKGKYRFIRK